MSTQPPVSSSTPIRRPGRMVAVLLLLLLACGCLDTPDSRVEEALISGVWHMPVGEDDYVYEFAYEDGVVKGMVHRITDDRHVNVIPVTGVILRDTEIEIEHLGFSSFVGQVDLESGVIEGGAPGDPAFSNATLVRVEATAWPMIRPDPAGDAGRSASTWSRPETLDDGWPTGTPEEVNIDPSSVEATIRAILRGEAAALHSLLVVRDGRLVVEEYFHGWSRDDLHHMASCTKSVASLLVGLAVDQGYIEHVHLPLLGLLPERVETAGEGWDAIELEHLLTMTMGLDWSEHEARGWPPLDDQIAAILARNVEVSPGRRFRYTDRNVNMLAGVLLQATGVEADVFAAEHLFSPLDIDTWDWEHRRWQGHPDMMAALKLRSRDMAKLGQMVLEEGRWRDRQVISTTWIRRSTRPHVFETPHFGAQYGYLWWHFPEAASPLGFITLAAGMGTQFIAVIPAAGLVVVTTGGNDLNGRQLDIVQLVEQHLAPGIH